MRRLRAPFGLVAALALMAVVGVSPALGAQAHVFSSTFGWHVDKTTEANVCTAASGDECGTAEAGGQAGQLSEPGAIAVNSTPNTLAEPTAGDVYVMDVRNNRVDQYTATGSFISAWGWGVSDGEEKYEVCTSSCRAGIPGRGVAQFQPTVQTGIENPSAIAVDSSGDPLDPSAGDVYVSQGELLYKFSANGTYLNTIHTGSGIVYGAAVDSHGTLWAYYTTSEAGANKIASFSDAVVNAPVAAFESPFGAESPGFAVDSDDDLYVDRGARVFAKLNSSGDILIEEVNQETSSAAGVDLSGDGVFIDNEGSIEELTAAGAPVFRFGEGRLTGSLGVAVNSANGTVYATDSVGNRIVVFTPVVLPDVTTGAVSGLGETTATLSGTVDPDGVAVTGCVFEYGTSAAYGQSAPCSSLPGSGEESVQVGVALTGLTPRTVYHYRLTATNANGETHGRDATFTTPVPPTVMEPWATNVDAVDATLNAQINPGGGETEYSFEYGPTTAYGSSVPIPEGDAGTGTTGVPVSVLVRGLSANTTYHYRIVAHNAVGTVESIDRTFTTQSDEASVLPDGRAWEMVSPPDKRGFGLEGLSNTGGLIQAAANGDAITYVASGPILGEAQGNRNFVPTQILSTRTEAGWSSTDIETPNENVVGLLNSDITEYRLFSSDLSVGLVEPKGDTPLSPQASERTPYRRETSGEYTPLVTPMNAPPGTHFGGVELKPNTFTNGVEFRGVATPDMSHVILQSVHPLTAGFADPENRGNVFEWSDSSLTLASVLPDGRAASEEQLDAQARAVSSDGSRVFWTSEGAAEHLYMRDTSRDETVQLDTAEEGATGGRSQPQLVSTSRDGSKVFFLDGARLTTDSTAGPGMDLYMCEITLVAERFACRLRDLTVDHNPGESANVLNGVAVVAGEDGRYVYFIARGVLAPGATPGSDPRECENGTQEFQFPTEGCNLYVSDTVTGETRFIARLAGLDIPQKAIAPSPEYGALTLGASPDGRYLAFMSRRSLTGYDNLDARSGQPDEEVYLYDALSGRLVCASCNPSGARPLGVFDNGGATNESNAPLLVDRPGNYGTPSSIGGSWLAGSIPGSVKINAGGSAFEPLHRPRYLSDSGRLFFNSADALVAGDGNGKEDVYEYEPGGVGSCDLGQGCVGLISSGTSGEESELVDASETGDDVFFLTASDLVPQDVDGALDLYDARVCSPSSPCLAGSAAQAPPCATADSCRAASSQQPAVFGAPASATFAGAGNVSQGASKSAVKRKALTAAQRLAKALQACHAKHDKHKRHLCEVSARKRYGAKSKTKKAVKSKTEKAVTHKGGK